MKQLALFILFNYLFVAGLMLYDTTTRAQSPEHWMEAWLIVGSMWYVGRKLFQNIEPPTASA